MRTSAPYLWAVAVFCFGGLQASASEGPTIGAVYDIIEPDALLEIESAVAGKSITLDDFGDSDHWSATQSQRLAVAQKNRTRDVIPWFSLPFDIPNPEGGILYPQGYTFNPLEYVRLPNTLWIVREDQLEWAFENSGTFDMIILSGGNALKQSNQRQHPVFMLESQLSARLNLEFAPSKVWQDGTVLKVQEFVPVPADSGDSESIKELTEASK
ncbi:MAG: conjugal transfer protein TraW [Pseudomonadota bacterium]